MSILRTGADPKFFTTRISIPLGSLHLSGGVKVLLLIANGLARRKHPVTLIVPDFASDSPFRLHSGISVHAVRTGPKWLPMPLRKLSYYMKLCWRSAAGADLCLANYYLTAYGVVLSRLLHGGRPRVLWYIQGYEAGSHGLMAEAGALSRGIRFLLASLSYRLPVKILCVSGWVKERIGRRDAVVVPPPALNLEVFRPGPREHREDRVVIGAIGRTGETKGYGDFLDALEKLIIPDGVQVTVLVASPKEGEVPLPTRFPSEGIHARTEEAMAGFYSRCDIFVLPSRMEGFPLPPLEAMACGSAVVSADCGGISEYGRDRVNCIIVPARSPEKLARAISLLIADPGFRWRLQQEGFQTAGQHGQEEGIARFLSNVV